jgi:Secretion system C-terminal sorting domain
MLLTEINYAGIAGAIPNDQGDPFSTNKVGIVEVPFIGPIRYTFAHEVAHHFGCWHSMPTIAGCPNGTYMPTITRNTIMANGPLGAAADNSRIQNFSNPAVVLTGMAGTRDNAAQIRGAFCEVANNMNSQFHAVVSKTTLGPICLWETHTFSANVFAGICTDPFTFEEFPCTTGPYQFEWRVSASPDFNFSQIIGNAQTVTHTIQNCPTYLRLTVTSANGLTTVTTVTLNCLGGPCDGLTPEPTDRSLQTKKSVQDRVQCRPNPANGELVVSSRDLESITHATIIDAAGNVKSQQRFSDGYTEIKLDVSSLAQGLWLLHVQGPKLDKVLKFNILR